VTDSEEFDEVFYLATNPDVAMAVRAGLIRSAYEHFTVYGKKEGRRGSRSDGTVGQTSEKQHRVEALGLIAGRGIEIGAFDSPSPVPSGCHVTYCDRLTTGEAKRVFPELAEAILQEPDVLVNIDRTGLAEFADASQDFVIFSHVVEHVANPIGALGEIFRVTRAGGHIVIGAPDCRFNFDRGRGLTPFEHVLDEYRSRVTEVSLVHYWDILALTRPDLAQSGVAVIESAARELQRRAEHAHVWNSAAFRAFLDRTLEVLGVRAPFVFEATGDQTHHEYFAVLEKRP
jgi:SAM-dependent methyltransferase